jgi:hypothetical protein
MDKGYFMALRIPMVDNFSHTKYTFWTALAIFHTTEILESQRVSRHDLMDLLLFYISVKVKRVGTSRGWDLKVGLSRTVSVSTSSGRPSPF